MSTSKFKSRKPNLIFLSPEYWPYIFKSRKSEKPCMEHRAKKIGKIASKHVQNKFGQSWQRFWEFLQFWKFFDFFENFRWLHWTLGKKTFSKKMPQITFGHLETFLDIFGTLKLFWFFPLIFSNSLPQNLGPENWTHIFQVRKTELILLNSGIWTHNFKSRTSEMELRILPVAWMQKECLLIFVS